MSAQLLPLVENMTVGEVLTPVTLLVATAGLIASIKKFLGPTVRNIQLMWEDWRGEEARPGVPRRPGVMERLSDIEHQLKPNGGGSIRDKIENIDRQLAQHIADKDAALSSIQMQIANLRKGIESR